MAWTRSGWHGSWFALALNQAASDHALTHDMGCALYDDRATPDPSAAVVARYGAGGYAAGEQFSDPGWPAGGFGLFNSAGRVVGDTVVAVADDLATITPVTLEPSGDMIYDEGSVISPGAALCFHYFGGPVPVLNGQFTLTWHADGIAVMGCPLLPRTTTVTVRSAPHRRAPRQRKKAA
jgi:hypothetical protein